MTTDAHVQSFRDLLLLQTDKELVVACDSVGGIGPRHGDTVTNNGRDSAHFAARVPLLEVVCSGARPIALINTLCQDRISAQPLIDEFKTIAHEAGIPPEGVTGSTEDNVPTTMTGIGVVVIGQLDEGLLSGGAHEGDLIICVGWPRSAPKDHLFRGHPDIAPLSAILTLVSSRSITDGLPVGSKGLAWEVPQLANSAGLVHEWIPEQPIPVDASGGPSSCVLISCAPKNEDYLHSLIDPIVPWTRVARLVKR